MSAIKVAELTTARTDHADLVLNDDPFRNHLGASTIGRKCAREIWYSWRWYTVVHYDPRMLRLFQRGHREEPIVLESLARAGIQSRAVDDHGKQFRFVGYKGHEGGSCDGFLWNVPEVPVGHWALFECKTHNTKSFTKIKATDSSGNNTGLRETKPEHYAQMQRYMQAWGLHWAVYAAVNKDTDERLFLVVPYVEEHANQVRIRAQQIVDSPAPPRRISENPTDWRCTFCDHKETCHNGAQPHRTCRSCIYASPVDGGVWVCTHVNHSISLSREAQFATCSDYTVNN